MGTRERRQREFAEREVLFLESALELIRADGLLNLQMARLADRCEYSVGVLYLHFASKEDLFVALITRMFTEYVELLRQIRLWKGSSRDQMFALGVAEIVFVRRHPDYFRVAQYTLCEVVWQAASPERRKIFLEMNDPLVQIVTEIVEEARNNKDLVCGSQSAQEMAIGVWALCSGFHNLSHAEGVMEDFSVSDPYPLMCRHIQSLLDGFQWKPLSNAEDRASINTLIDRIRREVFKDE